MPASCVAEHAEFRPVGALTRLAVARFNETGDYSRLSSTPHQSVYAKSARVVATLPIKASELAGKPNRGQFPFPWRRAYVCELARFMAGEITKPTGRDRAIGYFTIAEFAIARIDHVAQMIAAVVVAIAVERRAMSTRVVDSHKLPNPLQAVIARNRSASATKGTARSTISEGGCFCR
jgi:hypothetical protein